MRRACSSKVSSSVTHVVSNAHLDLIVLYRCAKWHHFTPWADIALLCALYIAYRRQITSKCDSLFPRVFWGIQVVEAVLPGDMSFLSFNPADADQLCIGGDSGLYFWRVDNLVDNWVRDRKLLILQKKICIVSSFYDEELL